MIEVYKLTGADQPPEEAAESVKLAGQNLWRAIMQFCATVGEVSAIEMTITGEASLDKLITINLTRHLPPAP